MTSFFEALGESRCRQIKTMSMDLAPIWRDPCEWFIPQAAICLDPFHVVRFAYRALDAVYQSMRFEQGTGTGNREWRRTRHALRAGPRN